jgi:hypothetical protein
MPHLYVELTDGTKDMWAYTTNEKLEESYQELKNNGSLVITDSVTNKRESVHVSKVSKTPFK